jgi:neutral ceramidase
MDMADHKFRAAIATIDVPPPLGVDMVGFLRRWEPATGYGQPLEVSALVVDDSEQRVALVALDLLATPNEDGAEMRAEVAGAAGCPPTHVLVNSQHTHAAPPPPGMLKLGGLRHELIGRERAYWEHLLAAAGSAVKLASTRLEPARMAVGQAELDGLSVNRRERLPDGRMILGRNEDGYCDRSVQALRFESLNGTPIGTVVSFACHPVVVGPDVSQVSSDFVGPMRQAVREWTKGADCMFLQGCAGNVLPLECFFDEPGREVDFGHRLALAALGAVEGADSLPLQLERSEYKSANAIARYRRVPRGGEFDSRVAAAEEMVELPLDRLPSLQEISSVRRELEDQVSSLKAAGAGPEQWNPVEIQSIWAQRAEQRIRERRAETSVTAPVQVLRIGRAAVVGLPGEPFSEIGSRIKTASPAAFTMTCGYSNAAVGYFPTTEEHPFGGYEVATNNRVYGLAAALAIGVDRRLQDAALRLLGRLFSD